MPRLLLSVSLAALVQTSAALAAELTAPSKIDAVTVYPAGAEVAQPNSSTATAGNVSLIVRVMNESTSCDFEFCMTGPFFCLGGIRQLVWY